MRWAVLMLWGVAWGDVGEVAVRAAAEVRLTELAAPPEAKGPGVSVAPGLSVAAGLGVDFAWELHLRYAFDGTSTQTDGAARWGQDRHALLAGVTWAPSDALTPFLSLETGAAVRRLHDRQTLLAGGTRAGPSHADSSAWAPAGRLTAGGRWAFADFWSLSFGAGAEHAAGWSILAHVALSAGAYL